jgi:hypothetical protein
VAGECSQRPATISALIHRHSLQMPWGRPETEAVGCCDVWQKEHFPADSTTKSHGSRIEPRPSATGLARPAPTGTASVDGPWSMVTSLTDEVGRPHLGVPRQTGLVERVADDEPGPLFVLQAERA